MTASMTQHESMPDIPRKSKQTARSLSQQETEAEISASIPDASRLPCHNSRRIPKCLWQRECRPAIPESPSEVHCCSHHYSSGTTSFLPQLEETHKIPPSVQDDARFPCITSRAIPCSTSNTKGGLTSFTKLQRVSRNTVTKLEDP